MQVETNLFLTQNSKAYLNQKEEIQNADMNSPKQQQRDIFNTEHEDEVTPFAATQDADRDLMLDNEDDEVINQTPQQASRHERRAKNQSMDTQIVRTYTTHKLYSDYLHQ